MDSSLKFLFKTSVFIFIALFISKILSLVYRVIVARYYGPEVYGLFSLSLMVIGLFVAFSSFGLLQGVLRYISFYRGKKEKEKVRYIFRISARFLIFSSVISAILLFFLSNFIAVGIFKNPSLTIFLKIFSIALPIFIFADVFMIILQAFEKIGTYAFISNIFQNIIKLLALGLMIFLGIGGNSIPISYIFGLFFVLISGYLYSKYKLPGIFEKENLNKKTKNKIAPKLFSYSWPLMFVGIIGTIFYWIDSFSIGYFKSAVEVGFYNAAVPIAALLLITPLLFLKLFSPLIIKEYARKKFILIKELSKQVGKWIFLINFPAFIFLVLFPGVALRFLFGGEYLVAGTALRFLSFGALISSIFLISHDLISMVGKSKVLLVSITISAALNVVLNIMLVPMPKILWIENSLGINGAAIATMISMLTLNALFLIQAKKYTTIIPLKRKMIKIAIMALIPTAILIYLRTLFSFTLIKVIVIGFLFFIFYFLLIFLTKCLDRNDIMILEAIKKKLFSYKDRKFPV